METPATTSAGNTARPAFGAFWHGNILPPYELACIHSFTSRGYEFTIFSYGEISNLPKGAKHGNAAEIAEEKYLHAFIIKGKPSISHFTDYFRFSMFQKTDLIWTDLDIVLLNDFKVANPRVIAGYETDTSICGAVLRLDNQDPRLAETLEKIREMSGQELFWGATGPRLLTKIYGAALTDEAVPPHVFYPISYDDYYKVFLPEFRDECAEKCKDSLTLHLWNNLVDKTGIWKKIGPPRGSYLYELFGESGANEYFLDFYPEDLLRVMVDNAVFHAGPDAGVKKVLRFLGPSIVNTVRRRL